TARIALPRSSGVIPISSWTAMKELSNGVVRTPPKSQTTASISGIRAGDLVGAQALAPLDRPAEEGDLGVEAAPLDPGRADQRAGPAQRPAVLGVRPQLQADPPL